MTLRGSIISGQAVVNARARWIPWLRYPVYMGCALAFATDLLREVNVQYGLFYLPLVCTAVFHRDARWVWWLTGIATAMITAGFFFPVINPDVAVSVINRSLNVLTVLATAILVHHARDIQERLAEETARAESAEELKSEVFTTLTTEMRQPLHALTAVSSVMMNDCRPDQRDALRHVQAGSQRLLGTLDNLIDLTRLDDTHLEVEPVNVTRLLQDVAGSTTSMARERQVTLSMVNARPARFARANSWATRRIVENIVANAVAVSPPGGTVELSTRACPNAISVVIRDDGQGISPEVLRQLVAPGAAAVTLPEAGSGLTLSHGLARAMGAELRFETDADQGTTVTLRLKP